MNKELIIERYKRPRYFSLDINPNGKSINSACGDEIYVEVVIQNNKINGVKYSGTGCSICLGTTDLLIDKLLGKDIEYVKKTIENIPLNLIGMNLDSPRKRCATLGLEAIKNSLIGVE